MKLTAQCVPVTHLRQNCTILADEEGRAIVIDPGGDVEILLQILVDQEVDAILLTHGHLDHAGGAAELKQALSAKQGKAVPILGPDRRDAPVLAAIEASAREFGMTGMHAVVPDRYLEDGEMLQVLGHTLEVAHLPGHTPGHVVFIDRVDGRAIVGDTLFRGTVGRTDFSYGDSSALLAGIRKHLFALPDDTAVLCGHGMPTTIGEERLTNPFFNPAS